MRIVDVTDLKRRAVTRKSAGTESRKAALMRQLRKGVILVHELREGRGAEELAYCGSHGTCIDKGGRVHVSEVMHRHALLDVLVHSGHTYSDLVLEQLTDAAQTPVSEVVYVVGRAYAVGQRKQVVDG